MSPAACVCLWLTLPLRALAGESEAATDGEPASLARPDEAADASPESGEEGRLEQSAQDTETTDAREPATDDVMAVNGDALAEPQSPEILLEAPLAEAPAASFSQAESASYSVAEKGKKKLLLPSQWVEVGGEIAFITSEANLTEHETRFSDVGLLRLRARRSFGDHVELNLHTQLLAKQPSSTDEPVWQEVGLGARGEISEGWAVGIGGSGGRLLSDAGYYWQAGPSLQAKPEISRYLRFLLGAGGTFTQLHFERAQEQPFWLVEATADAEVQAGDDNAVMWVGANYALPIASHPGNDDADPVHGSLDPQVRLGLEVGGALSLDTDDWDVYAVFSVLDRGELEAPNTTLPILDGGFDQQQIVIGVQHRFGPKKQAQEYY